MAAYLGLTSKTAPFGFTLPTGVEADSAEQTQTVAIDELSDGATNEYITVTPHHTVNSTLRVSGSGPNDFSFISAGTKTAGTYYATRLDQTEAPNQRVKFSLEAAKAEEFTDPGTVQPAPSVAAPTISGLTVTSVAYTVAESVARRKMATNAVLTGSDGAPAARAHHAVKQEFSIALRGDLPSGVALGQHGAYVHDMTGFLIVTTYTQTERLGEWNARGIDGSEYGGIAAVTE